MGVFICCLVVRRLEFCVVTAVEEFNHAVDHTLGIIGEVDDVGCRFLKGNDRQLTHKFLRNQWNY